MDKEKLYYQMLLVRFFEERMFELFSKGELFGTTHACIGQESNAVAVINNLEERDIVVSNHRCHGHYLVRTGDALGLMAEMMGKSGGICGGRGGSQHLCKDNFYTNGIQGNMVPVAAGMALAEKKKHTGAIVTLFIGDGTFGQGVVYETFNMISLWKVPILVVVENNYYAQTTPLALNFAGSFTGRARAFDISSSEIEHQDVMGMYEAFQKAVRFVREECRPHVCVLHTYRLCSHSKGDDFRAFEEIEEHREKDPLLLLEAQIPMELRVQIKEQVSKKINMSELLAREMPFANNL